MRISDWSSDVCSSDLIQINKGSPRDSNGARIAKAGHLLRVVSKPIVQDVLCVLTQNRRCRPAFSNIEGREFHSRAQGWNLAVFLVMQTLLHLALLHLRVRDDPLHIVSHRRRNLGLTRLANQLLGWMLYDFHIEN